MKTANGLFSPCGRTSCVQIGFADLSNAALRAAQFDLSGRKTKGPHKGALQFLARPERFELPTTWFEAEYLIYRNPKNISALLIEYCPNTLSVRPINRTKTFEAPNLCSFVFSD